MTKQHVELSGWSVRMLSRMLRLPVAGRAISRAINAFVIDRDLRAVDLTGRAGVAPMYAPRSAVNGGASAGRAPGAAATVLPGRDRDSTAQGDAVTRAGNTQ